MPITITPDVTVALIRGADSLLLVEHQGADDPAPYWSLPGGRVEAGETEEQSLAREIYEETGLDLQEINQLAYRVHVETGTRTYHTHIYEVTVSGKIAINDPDGKVLRAAFVPLAQAIAALGQIDHLPMAEPPVAYLGGEAPAGTLWRYGVRPDGSVHLISRHP